MDTPCGNAETETAPERPPKTVLFIEGMAHVSVARLREQIGKNISEMVEWLFETEAFVRRIRRLPRDIETVVLFIADGRRMSEVIALKDFMENIRLVLILSDEDPSLRRDARHLCPSYICPPDGDFRDLAAVLNKIQLRTRSIGRRPSPCRGGSPGYRKAVDDG